MLSSINIVRYWNSQAAMIKSKIMEKAWNRDLQTFTTTWGGDTVDSFLLLLPRIGFVEETDEHFLSTLKTLEKTLRVGDYLLSHPGEKTANNSATLR
jgi:GH15 family glucan-1,4-alpha-glucosidase